MSQPVPPTFKDIGKSANDLLNRDFPISGNKLEVKTLSPSGVVSLSRNAGELSLILQEIHRRWHPEPKGWLYCC